MPFIVSKCLGTIRASGNANQSRRKPWTGKSSAYGKARGISSASLDSVRFPSADAAGGRRKAELFTGFCGTLQKGGIKNTMTRQEAVNFLVKKPYKFGQMVGFSKLTDVHNGWMRHMLTGDKDYTLQGHRG